MSYEETWAKAAEANSQISKHFDHWLAIARGLNDMRAYLLAKSGANKEASPLYRRAYAEWVPTRSWAAKWAGTEKSSFRTACYWLAENQAEVEAWRAALDPRDRDHWHSPEVVMREYRKAQRKAQEAVKPDAPDASRSETPTEALKRENAELKAKVERLERTGGGESWFTLGGEAGSSPVFIVRVISESEKDGRFEAIFQAMVKERDRRRKLRAEAKKANAIHAG